jgi:hypothetical protein
MRIGVTIDGVLRDLLGQIEETHKKYFFNEDEDPIEVKDYDLEKWVTFPDEEATQGEMEFNPEFSEEIFLDSEETTELVKVTKKVTLEEFLYEKCTVEIFGYADETINSAVETLNQLTLDNPNHEFVLLSREGGMAVPSTLFFLAKTKSICTNIIFVKEYSKMWDYVDLMITDHPKVLDSKTNGKLSIVIDKDYNQMITEQPILRVRSIKEIDLNVLNEL